MRSFRPGAHSSSRRWRRVRRISRCKSRSTASPIRRAGFTSRAANGVDNRSAAIGRSRLPFAFSRQLKGASMSVIAAMAEAYQSQPVGEHVIETLELDHVTFAEPVRIATNTPDL